MTSDLHDRANAAFEAGRHAEALALYDQALAEAPNASLHYGRALALWGLGRPDAAIAAYDDALALEPDMVPAHYNRAITLHQLRRLPEALETYDRALALRTDMAALWNNRAGVLQEMQRYPEALDSLEKALRLEPRNDRGHYNRGALLMQLERHDEAIGALQLTLRLNPRHPDALGVLATAALKSCNWPLVAELAPRLKAEMMAGRAVLPPLMLINYSDDPVLQRKSAQTNLAVDLAKMHAPAAPAPLWRGEAYRHERLRLAYMSSDFRGHPVGIHVLSLLEAHDHGRFETIGLFTGRDDGSETHKRIVKAFDRFEYAEGVSDEALARRIRALEVDVLVDLNGQTHGWRPAVYKYRPAPVIATWLGFAGTIGAAFVDYVIGDAIVTPLQDQPNFCETIWQLPDTFWPAFVPPMLPPVTRADAGLPEQGFVFCCLNNVWKIGAAQFQVWMRLLAAVPGSVLWLRQGSEAMMTGFRREAKLRGIAPERLVFAVRADTALAHLARQQAADLFLDTFPYNAHATTADALAAGLPVVTMKGNSFASRVAASLLTAAGLPDLITDNLKDYEALALSLARDPARLSALREKLAAARATAPLFDPARFARAMEAGYTEMYARSGSTESLR